MWETDIKVAEILNEHHQDQQKKINEKRHPCTKYDIGDWVWVKRPPAVGGVGLKSLWHGAYRIVAQNGEDSYQVKNADSTLTGVHATQLARCEPSVCTQRGYSPRALLPVHWLSQRMSFLPGRLGVDGGHLSAVLQPTSPQPQKLGSFADCGFPARGPTGLDPPV